ncbi:hypothetical protein BaRGS_00038166 [Batillaria attramentaria]|uniref:Uncharacterized protein n=1 Tax=Batillaria attramentaria TaxID=370345 RepID=A0ABD0J6G6_9CAEN
MRATEKELKRVFLPPTERDESQLSVHCFSLRGVWRDTDDPEKRGGGGEYQVHIKASDRWRFGSLWSSPGSEERKDLSSQLEG